MRALHLMLDWDAKKVSMSIVESEEVISEHDRVVSELDEC